MSTNILLEWRNLNLTIKKREFGFKSCTINVEEKRILDNVNGNVKSGQLVAILGPSGAGKTTLLAGISQRFRGPLNGRISINGCEIDRKTMTNISCFVPQFDATMDTLTPNEHLYFMAELKLDRKWSKSRKSQRINFLIHELGLQHVANNRISGLSGGERKKLNLAADLLPDPPVIFCDEPTTGLDSFNARKVIAALKYLSQPNNDNSTVQSNERNGYGNENGMELMTADSRRSAKAIICSIHQPTSEIFQYFTHIILMYGGRCVFHGSRDEAITHFSKLGFHCPASYNPADFYLNVLSNASSNEQSANQSFFERPIEILRKPIEYQPPSLTFVDHFEVNDYKIQSPFWIGQVWLLIQRSMIGTKRSFRQILLELAWFAIPFVLIAILYHDTTGRSQETTRDVLGVFFMVSCSLIFTQAYSVMDFYAFKLPILRRETNEHIYKFSAYYIAEIFNALPVCILRVFVGVTLVYAWAAFNNGYILYLELLLTYFMAIFTAQAYGLMMSNLFKIAITDIASITDMIFMCISGFYMNISAFPYIRYISFLFYTNEATAILFFGNIQKIECPAKLNGKCSSNGNEILESLSYRTEFIDVVYDLGGLLGLALFMHIVAYFCTRRNIRSVGYY